MSDRKIALVTGANKGIGFEIARQLCGRGFIVALAARDAVKVGEAASRLGGQRIDAHGVALDITDPQTSEAAARQVDEQFGRLDVLVNNAAISPESVSERIKSSQLDLEMLKSIF